MYLFVSNKVNVGILKIKPCVHTSDMYPKESWCTTCYFLWIHYSPINYCHPTLCILIWRKFYVGDWVDIAKSLWVVVAICSQQRITFQMKVLWTVHCLYKFTEFTKYKHKLFFIRIHIVFSRRKPFVCISSLKENYLCAFKANHVCICFLKQTMCASVS